MRSKILIEILEESKNDFWFIKLRQWIKLKLWLLKTMHHGQIRSNLEKGILLIQDSPNTIKEYSSILLAYCVFKSSGGSIEQARQQLGVFHFDNKSTFIPANTLANQEIYLNEPCMKMIGTIKVFCCATTCSGLNNCRLKLNNEQKKS